MNTDLRRRFTGPVHFPGDAAYDTLRRSLNPAVDSRPAAVVEAAGTADVRAAVTVVRETGAPFAVQSTGHGTHTGLDGGVLLRTGGMASVLVDPDRRVAKVGPGARWAAVLAAAEPFGLAPLSARRRRSASPATRSAAASAGSVARTASPPTASCGPRWSPPTAGA